MSSQNTLATLRSFEKAKACIGTPQLEKGIEDTLACIFQHGLNQYLGVSLLHQHFPITEHNVLVKHSVGGEIVTKPRYLKKDDVPTLWKASAVTGQLAELISIEYWDANDKLAPQGRNTVKILQQNPQFLLEFTQILCNRDLQDMLGLVTRDGANYLNLNSQSTGNTIVETTEDDTLRLRYASANEMKGATPTSWVFEGTKPHYEIACTWHCVGHLP
ncbi:MAG: hypothetical protein WBB28_25865 [Crinalium sp.]